MNLKIYIPFPFEKNAEIFRKSVVSERAIKHISELTKVSEKIKTDLNTSIKWCILFVIVRDCDYFRPHKEACPIFSDTLSVAKSKGVALIAHQVEWIVNETEIHCQNKGTVPIKI